VRVGLCSRFVARAAGRLVSRASNSQGGIDDPTAGHSWECPGCRKTYDPGEYVAAVRLDLAADNAGWPTIAHAAATLAEHPVSEKTIRGWVEKGLGRVVHAGDEDRAARCAGRVLARRAAGGPPDGRREEPLRPLDAGA
jgi:hypothetical protein